MLLVQPKPTIQSCVHSNKFVVAAQELLRKNPRHCFEMIFFRLLNNKVTDL